MYSDTTHNNNCFKKSDAK